jgi:hypothetical protein
MNKQIQLHIREWTTGITIRLAIVLLVPAIMLFSCNKDRSSEFIPDRNNPANDTNWYARPATNAAVFQLDTLFCSNTTFSDSVTVATGGIYRAGNGLEIFFPPNFCAPQSAPGGKVKVLIVYLKKKGDFVRYAKPTSSNDKLFTNTAGAFNIVVTYDDHPVALAPGTSVQVRMPANISYPPAQVYSGDTGADSYPGNFNWVAVTDNSIPLQVFQQFDAGSNSWITGYQLQVKTLNWTAVAYPEDDITGKAKLSVLLPANYTNANTAVYAVFKMGKTVLRLKPDIYSKSFSANIPKGSIVSVIAVSKIGTTLYWSQDDVLVTASQIAKLKPQAQTLPQIDDLLNGL